MRFKSKKGVALLILLTFLFTSLFSTSLMGGARVAEATMGEDCGQIAERITEKDLVTPKWFDRFCINHIDIAANLVANVYVDGELHQEIAHLTPADAKYVKITAERNGHPVAFTQSDISVVSVDMFGNAQIRINGIFPIGTKANPVVYTVSIVKDVTVDTAYGDVHVPVNFVMQTHYWDLLNACPALTVLRGEWAKGLFILGSGIDIALGGCAEAEAPTGYLTIQKAVNGVELDEPKTFMFDIIDENGDLFKSVEVIVDGNTGLATVLNVPYGTYIVEEQATGLEIEGYNLVNVEYSAEDGEVTVCKSNRQPKVVVTNTYASEEVPDRVTGADFAVVKEEVEFTTNNIGEAVPAEKQQEVNDMTFGFDVVAAVVCADDAASFSSFEDAQTAAKTCDAVVEQIEVVNNGEAVDVAATMDNNYYFRLEAKPGEKLDMDVDVKTTTGEAVIWLFVSEDEEVADVDGLEWTCKIFRDGVKLADGNQLFTKLTTNSVYQFVNTYKLADTTTPDNPGPNPEPGDSGGGSGGGGGTDNPPPTDNGGSGGTDNTVTDNPDTTEPGTTDTPGATDEPEVVEPGETVEPKPVEPVEELPSDVPETGDNSHAVLYVALLFAAVAGLVAVRRQGNFR